MPAETDLPLWRAWCDGCALPNPGRMALGACLRSPEGEFHEISLALGHPGSNNEAEAQALLATLERAQALGARRLEVFSDSDLVVRAARAPLSEAAALAPLFATIRERLAGFEHAAVSWVPHRRNGRADELARAALGLPPRRSASPGKRRK